MNKKFWAWTLQDWHRYSGGAATWKAILVALVFNPGFLAVFLFRLSQSLHRSGHAVLGRLTWRSNLALCAVELHPEASVEAGLHLPHPYCVTIGQGCRVGKDVTLFQGVCLGARTVNSDGESPAREYPQVGDGVVFYPHALVYGSITIGPGATIMGNSVVGCTIPPDTVYGGVPAKEIKKRQSEA